MIPKSLLLLKLGSLAIKILPLEHTIKLVEFVSSKLVHRSNSPKAKQLSKNIKRVNPNLSDKALSKITRQGFASYGRYWVESLAMPNLSAQEISDGFHVEGMSNITSVLEGGFSPILGLPHLGGWEWGAAWLHRVNGLEVAAVVEKLEPVEVFEWFVALRQTYGIEVIALGDGAFKDLVKAVKAQKVICLLADRDIAGNGIEVDFFGETTTLPAGPALLSFRTGSPILPTAVFFDGDKRLAEVGKPIWPTKTGDLKDDLYQTTQSLALRLEGLICKAPEQWHMLNPNWPSDS